MTGSDLCASSKPWDLQMQTVTTIYEEFYMQGDSEMMAGRTPLPIMDRSFEDQQALHQDVCWFPPIISVSVVSMAHGLISTTSGITFAQLSKNCCT